MSTIMTASQQWATRPADERFVSLTEMLARMKGLRESSRSVTTSSRRISAEPMDDNKGLVLVGPDGNAANPTNWAFGQLAQLAEAPAGYLRTLPSPIACDALNYGLRYKRDVEDIGALLTRDNGEVSIRAITGPKYGRVWNADIVHSLVENFGDGRGLDTDWRVPGEFGQETEITKANTTLFAGDRDMFVFLADERNRVEVKDRRNGESGLMARGFFVSNSEVGDGTLQLDTFLFDYVCCNRIVWGAKQHKSIKIRHTSGAPDRWLEEVKPALALYHEASTMDITSAIANAKAKRLDDVGDFLAKRFGKRMPSMLHDVHMEEEGKPIETVWDVVTAVTAHAKTIKWQDDRVVLERKAGELLDMVA